jgi:hypothetical protein
MCMGDVLFYVNYVHYLAYRDAIVMQLVKFYVINEVILVFFCNTFCWNALASVYSLMHVNVHILE